jgi:hypothetical protein
MGFCCIVTLHEWREFRVDNSYIIFEHLMAYIGFVILEKRVEFRCDSVELALLGILLKDMQEQGVS